MKPISRNRRDASLSRFRPAWPRWALAAAIAFVTLAGAAPSVLAQSPAESAYMPVGDVRIAAIDNKGAVRNGPTKPVIIKSPEPIFIRSIQTYHWNNGRGRRPGTIALRSAAGDTYGPWQASGKPGQGGVPNAHWYVEPGIVLPAGAYVLVDSSPQTWATNDEAGNKGFVIIQFQRVRTVAASPEPATPAVGDSADETAVEAPAPEEPAAAATASAVPAPNAWRSPAEADAVRGERQRALRPPCGRGRQFRSRRALRRRRACRRRS